MKVSPPDRVFIRTPKQDSWFETCRKCAETWSPRLILFFLHPGGIRSCSIPQLHLHNEMKISLGIDLRTSWEIQTRLFYNWAFSNLLVQCSESSGSWFGNTHMVIYWQRWQNSEQWAPRCGLSFPASQAPMAGRGRWQGHGCEVPTMDLHFLLPSFIPDCWETVPVSAYTWCGRLAQCISEG